MKHRWRVDLHFLSGSTLGGWARLLARHRVDPAYAHRAAALGGLAAWNSVVRRLEPDPGGPFPVVRDPLYVVGHWRSGTTFLHHLLAADPRHVAPTLYQVVNPASSWASAPVSTRLFGGLVPERRLQDDVPLSFSTPEEDEYAIALLSGGSPYLGRVFPEAAAHHERFLTLRDCAPEEIAAFRAALRAFVARLARSAPGRRVVLKSPAHTARVPVLLAEHPEARFVHVHRHPDEVFASTRHLHDTVDWLWLLQRRVEPADAVILRQLRALTEAWLEDRARIDPRRVVEVAYDALAADPIGTLRRVYERLDLGPFAPAEPALRAHLRRVADHRPNRFPPLEPAERRAVREAAGGAFVAWGYAR